MFLGWIAPPLPTGLCTARPVHPCSSFGTSLTKLSSPSWMHSSQGQWNVAPEGAGEQEWQLIDTDAHDDLGNREPSQLRQRSLPRELFLRRAFSTAFLGVTASVALADPVLSMDSQRDRRTAVSPPPALLLPVQKMKVAAAKVTKLLEKPSGWEEARSLLRTPPLSNPDFAKTLDRYSDSNWEVHMLGDLYRNEGLASIEALEEVMAFVLQQESANGVGVSQEDIDDVRDAGRALISSIDAFLSLAPREDVSLVEKLVQDSSSVP